MGLCHLNHTVILKLLLLGIVNKLPNLKVSSSMIKKINLTWLLFLLGELAPPYQVLDVNVQFSCGLVLGLLDVWYSSMAFQWLELFSKLFGKALNTVCESSSLSWSTWSFKAVHSLRGLLASIEQDVSPLLPEGVPAIMKYCSNLSLYKVYAACLSSVFQSILGIMSAGMCITILVD